VKAPFGFGSSLSLFWTFAVFSPLFSTLFFPVDLALYLSPTLLDPVDAPGLPRCLSARAMEVWGLVIVEIIVVLQIEQVYC